MKNTEKTMDKIVALCKNRGFVFPGSEIYGGLANTWDYGPLGAELKKNIKNAWWKKFVQENPYSPNPRATPVFHSHLNGTGIRHLRHTHTKPLIKQQGGNESCSPTILNCRRELSGMGAGSTILHRKASASRVLQF